jgi:hypothetical protein
MIELGGNKKNGKKGYEDIQDEDNLGETSSLLSGASNISGSGVKKK